MRILALTNCFPRSDADPRTPWNRLQFAALAQRNDIRLIVPVPWTESVRTRKPAEVAGIPAVFPTFWFPPKILQPSYGPFLLHSIRSSVRHLVASFSPEVALACWAHPDGWAAVKIAAGLNIPAVVKVIGSDVLVLGKNPRRRAAIAATLKSAAAVIAVSRDLASNVVSLGVDPARVVVVPEGTDATRFTPGSKPAARAAVGQPAGPLLLFVGNLLFSKGAGVLLDACSELRHRKIEFHCVLVGSGKDGDALRAKAANLGLASSVTFVGSCPQDRLPDWYRAADVVVLPSFSEGIPNVLRESLLCGTPFVATAVGGIPEIAPPAFTKLVPPKDVAALTDALAEFLKSPPIVEMALVRRNTISWQESAERVEEVLADAVKRHRKVSPEHEGCRRKAFSDYVQPAATNS